MDGTADSLKNGRVLKYYDPCDGGFEYQDTEGSGESLCCCIASKVLDRNSDSDDMEKLRDIRDKYLANTVLGRGLIALYYSPCGMETGMFIENYIPATIPYLRNGIKNALKNYQIEK